MDEIKKFNSIVIIKKQRNARKYFTFIKGLPEELNITELISNLKKKLFCNGAVIEDKEFGKVIQFNGSHKEEIKEYLIKNDIATEEEIKLRGI